MARNAAWLAVALVLTGGLVISACAPLGGSDTAPTSTPRPTMSSTPAAPIATPTAAATATPTPVPVTATPTLNPNLNPLTGLVVTDTAVLRRRPIEVVINNMPVARPQYGLAQADLVFEYVMEGWSVTRFTAVYLAQEAPRIGPVRSARLVNLHLGPMFDAALVASGASMDVRWLLRNKGNFPYLDIDLDDSSNTGYSTSIGNYWETRLQTSTPALRKWLQKIGEERPANVRPFDFSAEKPRAAGSSGVSVHIPYPQNSIVDWSYDTATGAYFRTVAGERHTDGASNAQLAAANVVIVYTSHGKTGIIEDTLGNSAIQIGLAGEGHCVLLRDGRAYVGRWRWDAPLEAATIATGDTVVIPKVSEKRFTLTASDGTELALKPGATWFQLVPPDYQVELK